MGLKLLLLLVTFSLLKLSSQDNTKEPEGFSQNDINAFADVASSYLNEKNLEGIGGALNGFLNSEGGKQIGDMLLNAGGGGNNANQILQGIGSLLTQNAGGGGAEGGGLDPALIGTVLSAFSNQQGGGKSGKSGPGEEPEFDLGSMLGAFSGLLGQDGEGAGNLMSLLPMVMNTINSFTGEEAHRREINHSGHSMWLPPILEQIHIFFDHFMHSDLGRNIMTTLGTDKLVKVFADENGKFNYPKFVELLENHSFRKHWIELLTRRVASFVSYFADAKTQKKFVTTLQYFLNSFLKSQGFPKPTLFDPARPTETLTALANYASKKYLNHKINAKMYVKPAVEYIQDLLKLAQNKGLFMGDGIDSRELSHKLADTINLDMIEPIARVNRAFRFARRVPQCDRYVMCLVNQETDLNQQSLPGLKKLLSTSTSIVYSWFLSSETGTPFWSLYHVIMEENNCQARYLDACEKFHIEEVKVTTEYVHNEL